MTPDFNLAEARETMSRSWREGCRIQVVQQCVQEGENIDQKMCSHGRPLHEGARFCFADTKPGLGRER